MTLPLHPSLRFAAPGHIRRGEPLKALLDRQAVALIAASVATVAPRFAATRFLDDASAGLEALELKPRANRIGASLWQWLGDATGGGEAARVDILIAALGPKLNITAGFGLAPLFYLPHSSLLHDHPRETEVILRGCYALTSRYTAEYAIRPLIARDHQAVFKAFAQWVEDPDPHVRRLVSEGSRPRLPWAERLTALDADPTPMLPLLDRLVDDPDLYVRRSVANHLGDIAKRHPALAFERCEQWLAAPSKERNWVIRHAVRHPAKQGVAAALDLRRRAR